MLHNNDNGSRYLCVEFTYPDVLSLDQYFLSPRGLHEHARFSMRSPIVSARACCTGRAAATKGLSQDVYAAYRDIADVCHAGLQHWLHKPAENLALARRH
jgi:hypothetical protein